jgi:hypothetical protein
MCDVRVVVRDVGLIVRNVSVAMNPDTALPRYGSAPIRLCTPNRVRSTRESHANGFATSRRRADLEHETAQPAMRWIRIHARVPEK